jgi:hypothetical protein
MRDEGGMTDEQRNGSLDLTQLDRQARRVAEYTLGKYKDLRG